MANSSPGPHHTNGHRLGLSRWRPILAGLAAIGGIGLTVIAAFVLALQDLPVGTQPPLPTPVVVQSTPDTPTPVSTPTPSPSPTTIPTSAPPVEPTSTPTAEAPVVFPSATPTRTPTITQICTPPAGWVAYAVRPGDTLVSLAYRYRISVPQLMQANCLLNQVLYTGQVLFVPPITVVTPTPRPPCGPPATWVRYSVQPGDTLYSLAVRTYTTVYAIVQANCLTDYTLYAGQQLWLPYFPPPPTYTPTRVPPTITHTPTATATPVGYTPTPTLSPTTGADTPTPTPTSEPADTPTSTAVPSSTSTPTSTSVLPTATPTEPPTATPTPFPPTPTATSVPPTATPTELPTATPTLPPPTPTSEAPTATYTPPPVPPSPTATSPPTNTPVPFIPPTATSG